MIQISFQESQAEFDPSCCDQMNVIFLNLCCGLTFNLKVVFFYPKFPSSDEMTRYRSKTGLTVTPEIDAGFYFDLAVRSLTAVHDLKSAGSWPDMTYTKCSEVTGDDPIKRDVDLLSSMRVN